MSWKLVFALSLFGAAMGVATVFVIPTAIEPYFWLGIFGVCAVIIAKRAPGLYFLHGVCVSLVNGLWVTGAHWALYDRYVAGHAREIAMTAQYTAQWGPPKTMMLATGPIAGLASGLVLGTFAWVASKFLISSHSEYAGW